MAERAEMGGDNAAIMAESEGFGVVLAISGPALSAHLGLALKSRA